MGGERELKEDGEIFAPKLKLLKSSSLDKFKYFWARGKRENGNGRKEDGERGLNGEWRKWKDSGEVRQRK